MKVISFDIGIRNMAYCLFDISGQGSPLTILKWDVINLLEKPDTLVQCGCALESKSKNTISKICGKKAKYEKNGIFYCEKHAKKITAFMIPTAECSPPFLKKQKIEELVKIQTKYFPFYVIPEKPTKKAILDKLLADFENKCFHPIAVKKEKNSNDTDLISIGKNMKKILNEIEEFKEITDVIIENQISPIANRMKTIQGMLAQYFIMTHKEINIEFISSSNKLKNFILNPLTSKTPEKCESIKKEGYKENKKNGILYCSQILENNPSLHQWKPVLNTTKRDDLSDSFLQGIWYLKNKQKILLCGENLKIKNM